jgi:hypothetical protein
MWNPALAIASRGGTLTVTATSGTDSAMTSVTIVGTNPSAAEVMAYLASRPGSDGFGAIIAHETGTVHFNKSSVPMRSGDKGYGLCQLTNPRPTFEQVWNWQRNIDGGLALFAQKRNAAMAFLGQSGRPFTQEQLRFESVSRWNGGPYHRWDEQAKQWVRNPDILCDTKTGNIGWDLTDPENKGKTEAALRTRDKATYTVPRPAGVHWNFFGVCYADRVLG